MKKALLTAALCVLTANAYAETPYIEEVRALGSVAGQGLACGATKYDTFEQLARTILITKAQSDKIQEQGMMAYSNEKANAYISKQMDGFYECKTISRRFDNQDIFNMKVYEDGTIQMPDGKIFSPRTPYDARLVYDKKNQIKENAKSIYDGAANNKAEVKIKSEGVDSSQAVQVPISGVPAYEPEYNTVQPTVQQQLQQPVAKPATALEPTIGHIKRKSR